MKGSRDPTRNQRPEAIWNEKDELEGEIVEAMVVILRTSGCAWWRKSGCLMCGYHTASEEGIGIEELGTQLSAALERYEGEKMVKVYTSGSFLDPKEIPLKFRAKLFEAFADSDRILIESRPEFITRENLEGIERGRTQVAIGLETSSDEVRERSVNKGFTFADYERASLVLEEFDIPLRTYLLLKPPFMTEREAIEDAIVSVSRSAPFSESVSINPVNVQRDTLVERLWRRGEYRPPYWWSLVEVLTQGCSLTDVRIISVPSGAGTPRGIHNCGECDDKFIEAVRRFSLDQDANHLSLLSCDCKEEWGSLLEVQDIMCTSVDIGRYLDSMEN